MKVIITGGSDGIGAEMARQLARRRWWRPAWRASAASMR